jgi:hypothetical protein
MQTNQLAIFPALVSPPRVVLPDLKQFSMYVKLLGSPNKYYSTLLNSPWPPGISNNQSQLEDDEWKKVQLPQIQIGSQTKLAQDRLFMYPFQAHMTLHEVAGQLNAVGLGWKYLLPHLNALLQQSQLNKK